jgi:hypothetical protein
VLKHKKRAQCSGVRNPAEYRKRSELASASSIDKDFNFISSLERDLRRREDDLGSRGVGIGGTRISGKGMGIGLEKAAENRGVKLVRAPVGLTRRTENKTRVVPKAKAGGGGMMWTMEFLGGVGTKRRVQNFGEEMTVGEAWGRCYGTKKWAGKKRKREAEGQAGEENGEPEVELEKEETGGKENEDPRKVQEQDLKNQQEHITTKPIAENHDKQSRTDDIPDHLHFYLHRPQTSSKIRCLIPISKTDTIKDILKGRRVLEFPTVYVLDQAPSDLTTPFVLEKVYLEEHGEDVMIPQPPAPAAATEADLEDGEVAPDLAAMDESRMIEVLERDLISA